MEKSELSKKVGLSGSILQAHTENPLRPLNKKLIRTHRIHAETLSHISSTLQDVNILPSICCSLRHLSHLFPKLPTFAVNGSTPSGFVPATGRSGT